MDEHSIPVDLYNPGQVLACIGFLEAAEVLLNSAEGRFDWANETDVRFRLRAESERNPFEVVLEFLAETEVHPFGPVGYVDPPPKKNKKAREETDAEEHNEAGAESEQIAPGPELTETFPARKGDRMSLPIRIGGGNRPIVELGHWADGSGRETFKLYSGNRSADKIASAMLKGVRKHPSKNRAQNTDPGILKTKGIAQLWEEDRARLVERPLHILTQMGGSFNFDPRGAWTAIDAGYSPNDQKPKHLVEASPVVEFLAAWGLEHTRPTMSNERQVRYAVWATFLPACLARVALVGGIPSLFMKRFLFTLGASGKNKIVTFAEQEPNP